MKNITEPNLTVVFGGRCGLHPCFATILAPDGREVLRCETIETLVKAFGDPVWVKNTLERIRNIST